MPKKENRTPARRKTRRAQAGKAKASAAAAQAVPAVPDFAAMPRAALEAMHDAGRRLQECIQVLAKTNDNVVGELLRHQGTFYEWDHYPKGDVYDGETHAQYYYHAHPAPNRGREHGHFHTFLRPRGMPHGIKPAPLPDMQPPKEDNDALSHLIAISMNPVGAPIRLFTTNRWVTGETWYTADSVKAMLPSFAIGHAQPSWPANIWITNMLRLFRPQIEALIDARDQAIAAWQRDHPDSNVFEDRTLEVTSVMPISLARQLAAIKRALDRKSSSDL